MFVDSFGEVHEFGLFLRAPGNYDVDKASNEAGLVCPPEEGVTQQQFAEEVDINTIVKRFGLTGDLPENVRVPVSGDFTGVVDFASAMLAVRAAEEDFLALPAELRYRFGNDPQRLMDFIADDANIDEARKLGLLKPVVPASRDVVKAVDELHETFKTGMVAKS